MINFIKLSRIFIILNIFAPLTILALALEPRPESGVMDQANVLSEAVEMALAGQLRDAWEKHQLEVYVATYRLVKGETVAERAARLRNAWARNLYAIVLV